jgi:hypothetical protein
VIAAWRILLYSRGKILNELVKESAGSSSIHLITVLARRKFGGFLLAIRVQSISRKTGGFASENGRLLKRKAVL